MMIKKYFGKPSIYVVCSLILLVSVWTLYKVYRQQKEYKDTVDKIVGKKSLDKSDEIFTPLVASLEERFKAIVGGLKTNPQQYAEKYLKDNSETLSTEEDWIAYQSPYPSKVNYAYINFSKSYKQKNPAEAAPSVGSTPPNLSDEEKRRREEAKRLEEERQKEEDKSERYVFDAVLSETVSKLMAAKTKKYEDYSTLIWDMYFPEKRNRYLEIGKIFIGSKNNFAVLPYRAKPYRLTVTERDWWNAAYADGKERSPKEFYDLTSNSGNAGVTHIYPDIVSDEGITDLNRTLWYKFTNSDRDYVLGVDLRLSDFSPSIFSEIQFEMIALVTLCLLLPFLIYVNNKPRVSSEGNIEGIFKIIRVGRQKVSYNAGQSKVSEFSSKLSIRNAQEREFVSHSSWQFNVEVRPVKVARGINRQVTHQIAITDLTEVTVKKSFDLSLRTGNLKAVELWKVCRANDENNLLGIIEILWQNNRNTNDITLNQVYWDGNANASYTGILKELKKHLQTNESDSFIVDQTSVSVPEPDILDLLKVNLNYFKDFATRFDSFSNRVLLFDNNVPILKEIYSNNTSDVFATCSIEFLDNLKRQKQIKEILGHRIKMRYIIDGEIRKFKDFYNDLDEDEQAFLSSLQNLKIIEYKGSLETIYLNRDFCIMSFGNDKCVLYTDMSDETAQKGWISWREVDIEYYNAIKDFIESGDVQKKSINNYLGRI